MSKIALNNIVEKSELQILFIDDDETMSKIVASGITKYNPAWKVSIINSLDDLDFSTIYRFNLIILDLLMPGVDGIECLRKFSSKKIRSPIILISGLNSRMLSSAKNVGISYGLNIVGEFHKPIPWEIFLELIEASSNTHKNTPERNASIINIQKHEIETALKDDQFILYFQPQLSFSDLSLVGLEALIRWKHPVYGFIGPGFFLPLSESTGLAEAITLWVIQRALDSLNFLDQSINYRGKMSVNIPPLILNDYRLADKIINLVSNSKVEPSRLQLEIIESSLENNLVSSLDIQTRLAMRGLHLSIDDFGTGFSSLARLSTCYFDELKLDRFFIKKALFSKNDQTILTNMINLGHQMNMSIVGEGIEDFDTFLWLKSHGCDVAQGFLFSPPLPIDELQSWVKEELPKLKTCIL